MNYKKLQLLKKQIGFDIAELSAVLDVTHASARVIASRYNANGIFLRLKQNNYILHEEWEHLGQDGFFTIASKLQVSSYISLMTALSYYEVTTQVQQHVYESISLKRTRRFEIENTVFVYNKVNRFLYFGFDRHRNGFIAVKEKAFMDCVYLYSLGKYPFDISSIDMDKLDSRLLIKIARKYPKKTQKTLAVIWKH